MRGGADGGENRRPCPERPPSESCPFSEHFWLFCLNEEAFFFFSRMQTILNPDIKGKYLCRIKKKKTYHAEKHSLSLF